LYSRLIRARERHLSQRDKNRYVRPFEWGVNFIRGNVNGSDPRELFLQHTREVMSDSGNFYALPVIPDFELRNRLLTWTSAIRTPDEVNNTARARYFAVDDRGRVDGSRRAVVILPQWNAGAESHMELCRLLQRLGISSLRVTMPYHEERRPSGLDRADHLVSSNIGRTIQSVRQAVLDTKAAVEWLSQQGYNRIGIIGTSIGSCTAFLAFAHDPRIDVGVFNHVSGYFADVVWNGISTQHVRAGFGDRVTLDQLREYWAPISPLPFIRRLLNMQDRPMRFIAAKHDLTFPVDLSENVIAEVRKMGIPLDVAWLPCGHYTSGEKPWVYLDGWKITTFFRKHL
jgi:hypothetical protein